MKDKITIKAPEGYKAVYSDDGSEVTFVPTKKKLDRFMVGPSCIGTYIRFDGRTGKDNAVTRHQYNFGNLFQTEAQAQHMADYHRMNNMIFHACKLVNPEYEFVEGNYNFHPVWAGKKWSVDWWQANKTSPAYVATREGCEQVISLLNEWGVKGV